MRTYALKLKNGLRATFDFMHGTATLAYGNKTAQYSLNTILLDANNNDPQAAQAMYDSMYQSITAEHSDQITNSASSGLTGSQSPVTTYWSGDTGTVYGTPFPGSCWPVPNPCNTYTGGMGDWGTYNNWWSNPFGGPSGPPPSQPPDPNRCAPGDQDCRDWEHDRQNACDSFGSNLGHLIGGGIITAASCASAVGSEGALTALCLGALTNTSFDENTFLSNQKKCHTPYPGN